MVRRSKLTEEVPAQFLPEWKKRLQDKLLFPVFVFCQKPNPIRYRKRSFAADNILLQETHGHCFFYITFILQKLVALMPTGLARVGETFRQGNITNYSNLDRTKNGVGLTFLYKIYALFHGSMSQSVVYFRVLVETFVYSIRKHQEGIPWSGFYVFVNNTQSSVKTALSTRCVYYVVHITLPYAT